MSSRGSWRRSWRVGIIIALQLVCIGVVGRVLWNSREELPGAINFGILPVIGLLALNGLGHLQRTIEFTYTLRRLGVKEPLGEGFLLTGAGFLLNHLPLNAGFVMRAVVLQRDHALPYSSYLSLTLVNIVVNVAVAACIGIAGTCVGFLQQGSFSWPLFGALSAVLAGCATAIWFPRFAIPDGAQFVSRQIRNLATGVSMIRGDGGALIVLIALALTKTVGIALRLAICFSILNVRLSYFDAGLLAAVQNLMGLVNFTPGNLGLRELLLSMVSLELGTGRSLGMAAASIDRVVTIVYMLATGLPGLFALRRRGPLGGRSDRIGAA